MLALLLQIEGRGEDAVVFLVACRVEGRRQVVHFAVLDADRAPVIEFDPVRKLAAGPQEIELAVDEADVVAALIVLPLEIIEFFNDRQRQNNASPFKMERGGGIVNNDVGVENEGLP